MHRLTTLLTICITTGGGIVQLGCDDEARPIPVDPGPEVDTDTDHCAPFDWGRGLTPGKPVANWRQTGYMDADLNGEIEREEVSFSLDDIHCLGLRSIVLLIGGST